MTQPETHDTAGWTADDSSFGARLALVRQHMGWGNVKEAAQACGVPAETWRTWERDNRIPQRFVTICMAIATRTGCDLDWLIRGRTAPVPITDPAPNGRYVGTRVIAQIAPTSMLPESPLSERRSHLTPRSTHNGRPVAQTRPILRDTRRPLSASSR